MTRKCKLFSCVLSVGWNIGGKDTGEAVQCEVPGVGTKKAYKGIKNKDASFSCLLKKESVTCRPVRY